MLADGCAVFVTALRDFVLQGAARPSYPLSSRWTPCASCSTGPRRRRRRRGRRRRRTRRWERGRGRKRRTSFWREVCGASWRAAPPAACRGLGARTRTTAPLVPALGPQWLAMTLAFACLLSFVGLVLVAPRRNTSWGENGIAPASAAVCPSPPLSPTSFGPHRFGGGRDSLGCWSSTPQAPALPCPSE